MEKLLLTLAAHLQEESDLESLQAFRLHCQIGFNVARLQISTTPPAIYHLSTNPKVPQQILFAYDVKFATPLGTFPATGEAPAEVDSAVTVLGKQFKAQTEFFFTALAAPYFTNVVPDDPAKPAELNVPWLSEDLRVSNGRSVHRQGRQNGPDG